MGHGREGRALRGRAPLTAADCCRCRLAGQFLVTRDRRTAAEVVRALGAVQAQDFFGAKWALSQRTGGLAESEVEREFADGRILRTHVLRPTWHFVAPEDIRWMLELTAPRVSAAMTYYNRILELTPQLFRRSNDAIARALAGGKHLTRAELADALLRAGVGDVRTQRLGHLVMQAELDRVVCSGPRRGKQFTYALLDERVPAAPVLERDEALLELTRRYFATRGPATGQDFGWWSGLAMTDVKRGIEIAGGELQQVSIDGKAYQMWSDAPRPRRLAPSAHLLPNYDEYFIGLKDRRAIAARLGTAAVAAGAGVLSAHVVIVDGQLVGGWRRLATGKQATVSLELLTRLTRDEERRVATAVGRFGEFLGQPVSLEKQMKQMRMKS